MEKKLPKVFANTITKKFQNNSEFYYSKDELEKNKKEEKTSDNKTRNYQDKPVRQKIREIFKSPRYVYKAHVDIAFKDKSLKKQIVGMDGNHLITIENELIPIDDILDIKFSD